MALLGRANWYLPSWLRWLPELSADSDSTVKSVSA
jgi:hypothetical protein